MTNHDIVQRVVRSTIFYYAGEAALVAGGGIALLVAAVSHQNAPGGLAMLAVAALFSWLAIRKARLLWPIDRSEVVRELTAPTGSIAWAYRVRRGGPIGPWAGCVQLCFVDARTVRLFTNEKNADALLAVIAETNPTAAIGYSNEARLAYKQRRRQLST